MSKKNVVYEHRSNGGRFYTSYDPEKTYEDNEHHLIVAKDVTDEMALALCHERANQNATAFLNDTPEELRDPEMDNVIREMLGADLEPISDERKMEMPDHINLDALQGGDAQYRFDNLNPLLTISGNEIEANNIIFYVDNGKTEVLKLCGNGDIFVRGKLAENDKEVVQGLRDFLKAVPKSQN